MKPQNRTLLKRTFRAGIMLKAVYAVLEVIGGISLWLIPPSAMTSVVRAVVEHELSGDRHDFIAIHVLRTSKVLLSSNRLFASMYLLSHGAVKVILVIALWMNALWAYPLTIFVFGGFGAYQMYRYSHTHSIAMLLLTIFDAALICLTWMEWREQKAEKRSHSAPPFLVR
jgi:uncharacterized membrane protein